MRTDPDKAKEFVHSEDWGRSLTKLVYAVPKKGGNGPSMQMHSLSAGERNRLFIAGYDYADLSLFSGMDCREDGRGFALWDYDDDGYQDVIVMSPMAPRVRVFRNEIFKMTGAGNKRIAIKLVGGNHSSSASLELSNRDAVGAEIVVTGSDGGKRIFQRMIGQGFATQNSGWVWIGMGETESADIEIHWPSGKNSSLKKIAAGTKRVIVEP